MAGYPESTWRLIFSPAADGATQMAVDEAIWRAVAAGRALPTLRFYAWSPPCLSLGRHQPLEQVNRAALQEAGYGLVRRPTGGKAILHTDELTYSLAVSLADPRVRGGVLESCARLSRGLLLGLQILGIRDATASRRESRSPLGPVCFEEAADFEIAVEGRKIVGSAQVRGGGGLLQHGSLPLWGDITRVCRFLVPAADPERVRGRAATLEEIGQRVSWVEAAQAMAEGFARALSLRLEPGDLSDEEQEAAERLRVEKYNSEAWTARH